MHEGDHGPRQGEGTQGRAGKSLPTIAREMNLSITTVARICKDAA